MNKLELVKALAQRLELPRATVSKAVDALFGSDSLIAAELRRGRKVQLTGFGTFEPRRRQARTARNPRTGRTMTIKASLVPTFKAAKSLKDGVNRR